MNKKLLTSIIMSVTIVGFASPQLTTSAEKSVVQSVQREEVKNIANEIKEGKQEITKQFKINESKDNKIENTKEEKVENKPMTVTMNNSGNVISRGGEHEVRNMEFALSFYSSLPEENGGHTITCNGKPLEYGVIASNYYKQGTRIYLEDYGWFTVADRGGKEFNNPNRLDILMPRESGESNSQYRKRLMNLGRKTVKGYIVLE